MQLSYLKSGKGKPLIILHGLYGSADNWHTIGKTLSADFTVYIVNQRNHGDSPHHHVHTYDAMSEDLFEFFNNHGIEKALIIGHSMGGKTAMSFALKYPYLIEKLIVVDIAPGSYNEAERKNISEIHSKIISSLQMLPLENINSRKQAEDLLSGSIPSSIVRKFLLKNLKRIDSRYSWKLNIEALANNLEAISSAVIQEKDNKSNIPTLFIRGEKSLYINQKDEAIIKQVFSDSEIVTIPDSGHWIHAEQPQLFIKEVMNFFNAG